MRQSTYIEAQAVVPFKHSVIDQGHSHLVVSTRHVNGRVALSCANNLVIIRRTDDLLKVIEHPNQAA